MKLWKTVDLGTAKKPTWLNFAPKIKQGLDIGTGVGYWNGLGTVSHPSQGQLSRAALATALGYGALDTKKPAVWPYAQGPHLHSLKGWFGQDASAPVAAPDGSVAPPSDYWTQIKTGTLFPDQIVGYSTKSILVLLLLLMILKAQRG